MTTVQEISHLRAAKEEAERACQESRVFLKNLIAVIPQHLFWKDRNSVYQGCNDNFAQLVGLTSVNEIIGKTDFDLGWRADTGDSAELFRQGDLETLAGKYIVDQEETLSLPNGNEIIVVVNKVPIMDDKGEVIGVLGLATDITDRKRIEKELLLSNKKTEIANKAKDDFIANISHDIRTPLSGILGLADTLSTKTKNTEDQALMQKLSKSSYSLLDLLNEVIEFSSVESGGLPINARRFDLYCMVEEISSLLMATLHQKNISYNVNIDPRIQRYLIGDRTRLHRVLLNLLSNAIKFTNHGTVSLFIMLAKENGREVVLQFKVVDTGIGIDQENQDLVFSKFTRLNPTYKGRFPGTGLGLTIVKQFIDELSGEIEVESTLGKGTKFTCAIPFTIPLIDESPDEASRMSNGRTGVLQLMDVSTRNVIPFKRTPCISTVISADSEADVSISVCPRVLVVEDHPLISESTKKKIASFGYNVDIALSGEDALEILENNSYDLIFMDIGLPGMDGIDATKHIRKLELNGKKRTPIVALTAHVDGEGKKACFKVGVDFIMLKPLLDLDAQQVLSQYAPKKKEEQSARIHRSKGSFTKKQRNNKIIDIDLGAKMLGGDRVAAINLINKLIDEIPMILNEMTKVYRKKDYCSLNKITHKFLGGACYCGVPRLTASLESLNISLKKNEYNAVAVLYEQAVEAMLEVIRENALTIEA